jgi:hypothetical protein
VTRAAQTIFALLVCATFAAFFVTQRLKRAPLVVRQLTVFDRFSPTGDGRADAASIRFRLNRSDDVTVQMIDSEGSVVRTLARDRRLAGKRPLQFYWDGKTDRGSVAPDGPYRVRIGLRNQGRSVILRRKVSVDTEPPRPVVTVSGTVPPGMTIRVDGLILGAPRFEVYRLENGVRRLVTAFDGRRGSPDGRWNGLARGRPVPPGTYVIAARVSDEVGNLGVSPPLRPTKPGESRGRPEIAVAGRRR